MKRRESVVGQVRCSDLGEEALLSELLQVVRARRSSVVLGAGDDCAVVRFAPAGGFLLLKTDCVVEGIHFTTKTAPALVGRKAMGRPLSDFAAMSGIPQFALVTLVVPANRKVDWVTKMYRGLNQAARAFQVAIVGGETTNTNGPVVISVSVTGFVEKNRWVNRAGGRAGDELFVTGRLGGSRGGKHLRFIPRIEEARWLTKNFSIRAMMDLSDGLGADLPRLARASAVGFELNEVAIPRSRGCTLHQACNDGEDYELLFAVSPRDGARLLTRWRKRFPGLPLTRIGRLKSKSEGRNSRLPSGYVHFQQR